MCGIAGIVGLSPDLHPPAPWLAAMNRAMAHRGPDDEGIFQDRNCGFAHRRLSIVDLSPTGKQPMTSLDGRVTITYNGELYNDAELRGYLASRGVRFRGSSDTETLVELLALDGWNALPKLAGMFAVAAWFRDSGEVLLARDSGGIKPLFYSKQPAWFVFASEIPVIFASSLVPPRIDQHALGQYIRHAQPVLGTRTLWGNLLAVPPGGWLRLTSDGSISIGYFWRSPVDVISPKPAQEQHIAQRVQELLAAEVAAELRADVPVGAYLSGGVDSSILLAEMVKVAPDQVRTFGISFKESGFDERRFAELVARALKVKHTQYTYDLSDYLTDWTYLIQQRGMPLTVPNEPPLLQLAREAAKEVKVVLTGEGSDELFGGYPLLMRAPFDYYRSRLLQDNPGLFSQPELIRESLSAAYGRSSFPSPLDHFLRAYRWIPLPLSVILFGIDRAKHYEEDPFLDTFWREQFERISTLSYDDQIVQLLWNVHLPGLLGRIDATTMAASIEGRVPFVGKPVVEYGLSLPASLKVRFRSEDDEARAFQLPLPEAVQKHDVAKLILREAYRNRIPESIRTRTKTSFPVPLDSWFSGQLRASARDRLMACAEQSHWFDREGVEFLFSKALPSGSGIALWMALNLALFYEAQQNAVRNIARG